MDKDQIVKHIKAFENTLRKIDNEIIDYTYKIDNRFAKNCLEDAESELFNAILHLESIDLLED